MKWNERAKKCLNYGSRIVQKNSFDPVPFKIEITGGYTAVWGYDCLNGIMQELKTEKYGKGILIKGLLIKDYPTLIRLKD